MFRPFLYPSNHDKRQMYNSYRGNSVSRSGGNQTMELPKVSPVFNETNINFTDPIIVNFLKSNPKTGYVKMKVCTAHGAHPICSVNITVFKEEGDRKYPIASEKTDTNGLTTPIALPAPDKLQSFIPHNPNPPYAAYTILVEHPQYKAMEFKHIPVFDGITTVQLADLTVYK